MRLNITNCLALVTGLGALAAGGCESLNALAEERPPSNAASQEPRKPASKSRVREVDSMTLKAAPYTSSTEVTGKTIALKEGYLSLPVPGLIKKINVELGDRVKKGEVLLRLDRRGFQLSVAQAAAALDGATAATDQLATEITRMDKLLAEGAAPSAAKDDLLAKDKGAKAQTRAATAALEQAQKALKDAVLRAPYDGVIAAILKEEGEQAPAMPPTMLMKIVDTSKLDVQVFVPEASSRFVKVGDTAEVVVDSADVVTRGEAVFVSNVIQPGTRTFEVRYRIENPDDRIKAGAFARVRLAEEALEDAILVPVSAMERDENDAPYVFIAEHGRARRVPVVLGAPKGAKVLVRKGLQGGQTLITSDLATLDDGDRIRTAE